jgi:ubiquinone/menaquinone biosynthesis C-methylase UbiE
MSEQTGSPAPQRADTAASRYSDTRGYTQPILNYMTRRTAEREGAFFLPHLQPGMRVLDVGCGPGTITLGLARAVAPAEVVGIDIEPSQIDASRALAAEQGVTNLRFAVGNGEALDFPDASFDAVFSYATIEHIPDPLVVLRELRRVVRPGGLARVDASDWGGRVTHPPSPVMEEAIATYVRLWEHNGGHARLGRELPKLLRTAGFTRLQTTAGSLQMMPGVFEVISAPRFVERVTALSWADHAAIARWGAAFREWEANPDAVWAHLRFRTVGWAD